MAQPAGEGALLFGDMEVRPAEFEVLVRGRRAGLTVREFQLFLCLVQRIDHVVRRPDIYAAVWGAPMAHRDRSVDVFVRKIRLKLALVDPATTYIHTHFGVGYRFCPELAGQATGDGVSVPA